MHGGCTSQDELPKLLCSSERIWARARVCSSAPGPEGPPPENPRGGAGGILTARQFPDPQLAPEAAVHRRSMHPQTDASTSHAYPSRTRGRGDRVSRTVCRDNQGSCSATREDTGYGAGVKEFPETGRQAASPVPAIPARIRKKLGALNHRWLDHGLSPTSRGLKDEGPNPKEQSEACAHLRVPGSQEDPGWPQDHRQSAAAPRRVPRPEPVDGLPSRPSFATSVSVLLDPQPGSHAG